MIATLDNEAQLYAINAQALPGRDNCSRYFYALACDGLLVDFGTYQNFTDLPAARKSIRDSAGLLQACSYYPPARKMPQVDNPDVIMGELAQRFYLAIRGAEPDTHDAADATLAYANRLIIWSRRNLNPEYMDLWRYLCQFDEAMNNGRPCWQPLVLQPWQPQPDLMFWGPGEVQTLNQWVTQ